MLEIMRTPDNCNPVKVTGRKYDYTISRTAAGEFAVDVDGWNMSERYICRFLIDCKRLIKDCENGLYD